jgi:hypothetical protein
MFLSCYPAAGKWQIGDSPARDTREVFNEHVPKWQKVKFFGTLKPQLTKDKIRKLLEPHA